MGEVLPKNVKMEEKMHQKDISLYTQSNLRKCSPLKAK